MACIERYFITGQLNQRILLNVGDFWATGYITYIDILVLVAFAGALILLHLMDIYSWVPYRASKRIFYGPYHVIHAVTISRLSEFAQFEATPQLFYIGWNQFLQATTFVHLQDW